MASEVPETKADAKQKRMFKVNTKKQLIIAVQCCIGVYNVETVISYGKDATYKLRFKHQAFDYHYSEYQCDILLKELKKKYDKRLRGIIKNIKKTKF